MKHELMRNESDQPENEPIVICTYGPSGIGKTTDMGYSFPNALFLASPGGLNSVRSVCGYKPKQVQVKTLADATTIIKEAAAHFDEVVIDELSFLGEQTLSFWEGKMKGFKLWGKLRDEALEFRNTARFSSLKKIIFNCWEKGPKVKDDGTRVKGGPALSGRLPESIPALCDLVLRGRYDGGNQPWTGVYRCQGSDDYVMKDRYNIAALVDPCPMNLGELLRAIPGVEVPRHKDFPHQEEQVEAISQNLSGVLKEDINVLNEVYASLVSTGTSFQEARWTLRDALDRAVIRRALNQARSTFCAQPQLGKLLQ